MVRIETDRLRIRPLSSEELSSLVERYSASAPALSDAYREMLCHCRAHPGRHVWYAPWKICLKATREEIGFAGFKGLQPDGSAEIGYGIHPGFEGFGFATEAVAALCRWALAQRGVRRIEAETAPDNPASIKVLKKNGFALTGETGREGPRFIYSGESGGA